MAKTKKEKKEKKAGKRMKKKELVKALLDFFHAKQDEVLSLKYIFEQGKRMIWQPPTFPRRYRWHVPVSR